MTYQFPAQSTAQDIRDLAEVARIFNARVARLSVNDAALGQRLTESMYDTEKQDLFILSQQEKADKPDYALTRANMLAEILDRIGDGAVIGQRLIADQNTDQNRQLAERHTPAFALLFTP